MASLPAKPQPHPTPTTQPFWDGLREHRFMIQYSPSSDKWVFYPRTLTPRTLVDDLEWREIAGTGVIYTYTVARSPTAPPWAGDSPQLLGVVQLDEGPRLTAEFVNAAPEALKIGLRVRPVYFDNAETGVTMVRFEPIP